MRKQEIINYNLVNFDKLIAANCSKSTFIDDFNLSNIETGYLSEPETGYLIIADGYKGYKYVSIIYNVSSNHAYQFGFTNRNRLRNFIKTIQFYDKNITARFIAEVKHE